MAGPTAPAGLAVLHPYRICPWLTRCERYSSVGDLLLFPVVIRSLSKDQLAPQACPRSGRTQSPVGADAGVAVEVAYLVVFHDEGHLHIGPRHLHPPSSSTHKQQLLRNS